MLNPKFQRLIERYPQAEKLVNIAAHYEEHTPIYQLCEFMLELVNDIITAEAPQPETPIDG